MAQVQWKGTIYLQLDRSWMPDWSEPHAKIALVANVFEASPLKVFSP
jgi:hypothetical protein